jgi:hypothetical protein
MRAFCFAAVSRCELQECAFNPFCGALRV